jgi:4,5-DOPA dioxygenase extradiol
MSGSGAGAPPAVFVSHGAPTLLLEGGPAVDFLASLGNALGKPSAVICVSAHWETDAPAVSAAKRPETIHDFSGFPRELYAMGYPADGAPALAARVRDALAGAGFAATIDPERGLDHGAWVPMKLMYPDADVPIFQLSVQPHRDPAHHLAVGRALAGLRDEGVLVLGSGGAIHNLRALRWGADAPEPWATGFADWLDRTVAAGAVDDLVHYRQRGPGSPRAHPTDEHFLPLFVALGAGGAGEGKRLHGSFTHGNLGMHAYAWGDTPG